MTSEANSVDEVFVWVWLPNQIAPVVAGRLRTSDGLHFFDYGNSYLSRADAVSIYEPELPFKNGSISPIGDLSLANCIEDALPGTWGRRVLASRETRQGDPMNIGDLHPFTLMLDSGSDRIGALDFQLSSREYSPREASSHSLEALHQAVDALDSRAHLPTELLLAVQHATSVGGARPKVLWTDNGKKYIVKFSQSAEPYDMVKSEFTAMRLASLAGLDVANVDLTKAKERDVLLIERFDRVSVGKGWGRKMVVSALTLLGMNEVVAARNASYELLAENVRIRFLEPKASLRELFSRLAFNILVGNTDDSARNHSAFWNGRDLALTPAYDICPQQRPATEASQGMSISRDRRTSRLSIAVESCNCYLLHRDDALTIIGQQIAAIKENWNGVCDDCSMSDFERDYLWRRQFLNAFAFEGLEGELHDWIQDL